MLIIGGAETFPKVFSNGVYRLHQHPDQRAELAAHPRDIPDAFIEILRYDMPTQFLGRMLKQDHELHGEKLLEGQPVLFLYPSANRDEREFPDPDRFDVKRRPPRILSFGHGIHSCIGLHFAKLEGRLCFETILRHLPGYEVVEDRLERLRTEFVQGFAAMPVRFRPF
jgi:cytochrome P450